MGNSRADLKASFANLLDAKKNDHLKRLSLLKIVTLNGQIDKVIKQLAEKNAKIEENRVKFEELKDFHAEEIRKNYKLDERIAVLENKVIQLSESKSELTKQIKILVDQNAKL